MRILLRCLTLRALLLLLQHGELIYTQYRVGLPGSDPTKKRILETLVEAGLVEEQRSRKTRRLKLTAKGRIVAMKVREIQVILQEDDA